MHLCVCPSQLPKKVLLIDDESCGRILLRKQLEVAFGSQLEFREAECGQDATAMLGTEMFDAVVCDMEMPRGNGFSVFVFWKTRKMQSRFVFFTAAQSIHFPSEDSFFLGAVQKPNSEILVSKLRESLCLK